MKIKTNTCYLAVLLGSVLVAACSNEAPQTPPAAQSAPIEQSQPVAAAASEPGGSASGVIDAVRPATVRFHYQRAGGDYEGWGVYAWKGVKAEPPQWPANLAFEKTDAFGMYIDVPVDTTAAMMDFLVTNGTGRKDCPTDQSVTYPPTITTKGAEVWIKSGDCKVYTEQP